MIPSDCFLNSPTGSTEQNSDHSRCKRKELIHYVQQVPQGFGLNSLQDLVERAVRLESLLQVWYEGRSEVGYLAQSPGFPMTLSA